ncbi:ribonucleoprotein PTB-binding 1-like [Planococcus citri]|uniref:ribonucleoprotein PTB-binding 1-like n=1 Tax=Planococcus citri TaxID=170843 RepID=UPI0031F87121
MSTSCANIPFVASSVLSRYAASPIVTASVSTTNDQYWDDTNDTKPSPAALTLTLDDVKQKISVIKSKFHQDRKLLVKHLPRNVVKQEISQLLSDYRIKYIHITSNDDTSGTAMVTLEDPHILEDWNTDNPFFLRGQSVSVSPTPTEMLLCVARLPLYYGEDEFYNMIKSYGDIKTYFLMISEKTGKSKGYGFVQYTNKEHAMAARNALNDKIVDTFRLVCDWLDSSHLTLKSLHSKCLYVDKLPNNFRDMGEFRKVFAKVVNPPYCQIALKNGCPLDWGLVEYLTAEDAELAQTSCNNVPIRNQPIRVVFYIPGVRAINLYLRLLNDMPPKGKSAGLLPDPSGQSIMQSIQNLSKQNPIFAQNLKNIILHQIQESKLSKDDDSQSAPTSKSAQDTKIIDRMPPTHGVVKNGKLLEEKLGPSPPPPSNVASAAGIVNTLPMINANGFVSQTAVPTIVANTAVPPPLVEKLAAYPRPLSINVKEKPPGAAAACLNPQLFWNDLISPTSFHQLNGAYTPMVPATIPIEPTPPPAPATAAFTVPAVSAAQMPPPPNFLHEIINLPNMQQNLLSLINHHPSPACTVSHSVPNLTAVATPAIFSTLNPAGALEAANWSTTLTGAGAEAALIPTPLPPQFLTAVPKSAAALIPNWPPSIPTFIPPSSIPTVFTSECWQTTASMPHSFIVTQAASTPIVTGQKRKLLPSPEKSPEGSYIGQHSQGIGGHYADSYFKKKKMF